MVEVRYDKNHHAGPDANARIANRLRNSGAGAEPDHIATHGTGPTRTHTNTHEAGHPIAPGTLPDKNAGR
jgi:hypothetical protein